jgi:hypothetical protein
MGSTSSNSASVAPSPAGNEGAKKAQQAPPPSSSSSSAAFSSSLGNVHNVDQAKPDLDLFASRIVPKSQLNYQRPTDSTAPQVSATAAAAAAAAANPAGSVQLPPGTEHLNEQGVPDVLRQGRYRVAQPATLELLRAQQPNNQMVQQQQMEQQMQDMRKYLEETEGLKIGTRRMSELSQQWRFFLACEPIQRGLDAGFLLGSFSAALGAFIKPKNRKPMRVLWLWMGGFCAGMVLFPASLLGYEQYNMQRIMAKEEQMFQHQRQDFFDQLKKR